MKCPKCKNEVIVNTDKEIVFCIACDIVYHISKDTYIKVSEPINLNETPVIDGLMIPDFEVNDVVINIDKYSPLFLEYGTVMETDHLYVRVKFNEVLVWLYYKTIEKAPKEWLTTT